MDSVLLRYSATRFLYSYITTLYSATLLHDCRSTATLLHYCQVLLHTLAALRHHCYTASTLRVNSHNKHIIVLHYIPQHCNTTAALLHYWPHYCRITASFLHYWLHYWARYSTTLPRWPQHCYITAPHSVRYTLHYSAQIAPSLCLDHC